MKSLLLAALLLSVVMPGVDTSSAQELFLGAPTFTVSTNSWLSFTNNSTNAYYLSALDLSFSNNVGSSGAFSLYRTRGMVSNLLFQVSFSDVTNLVWYPSGKIYFALNDVFRFHNGATNTLFLIPNLVR